MFAANRGNHFLAAITRAEVGRMTLHNRIPQLGSAGHRRVLCEIPLNCRNRCVLDVLWRREMGFARPEIDHVDTLPAQLICFRHNRHGGGWFYPVDAFGQLDGVAHFGRGCHAFFLALDFRLSDFSSLLPLVNSANLKAGSSFPRRCCSTSSGTRLFTDPPSCATSRTSRALKYEYFSAGIMNTVSNSGRNLRFIKAICSSYS